MKPKLKRPRLKPDLDPELVRLSAGVGAFIRYWGFKEVQGRLWFYLFIAQEPLSSFELSQLLKISPALVTQSVQVLLKYRVILSAPKGPNGVLRYQANPNVSEAIAGVLRKRELALLDGIAQASESAVLKLRSRPDDERKTSSGLSVSTEKVEQIQSWLQFFQSLLLMGLQSLEGPENPFGLLAESRSGPAGPAGRVSKRSES